MVYRIDILALSVHKVPHEALLTAGEREQMGDARIS